MSGWRLPHSPGTVERFDPDAQVTQDFGWQVFFHNNDKMDGSKRANPVIRIQ
jgi:hypothetical protein